MSSDDDSDGQEDMDVSQGGQQGRKTSGQLGLRLILVLAKDRCRTSFEAWFWPKINPLPMFVYIPTN